MSEQSGLEVLKKKLETVSQTAGVYRMINTDGKVIYVGKAKNLKKRLTNYTRLDGLSYRIRQMVSEVAEVITIETAGETEALILENNLIKTFRPYYNILLKDDKSYPYILITKENIPRLMKYRGAHTVKGDYFGPFTSGLMVGQTIKELQKIFGLRVCNNSYFSNRTRPCLLAQIGRCSAPCVGKISNSDYKARVQEALKFMHGETTDIQVRLQEQMHALSEHQEYEKAAAVRDKILSLNRIQNTESEKIIKDTDIVACYHENDSMCVQVFFYRSGHNQGNIVHYFDDIDDQNRADFLSSFLMQFYDKMPPPKHILISEEMTGEVAKALSSQAGFPVSITGRKHTRGATRKLVENAVQNAAQSYHEHIQSAAIQNQVWEELRNLLKVPTLDKVEIYDNSHIQGAFAVGAMVAATREGFQKKLYRRFNIDGTCAKTNDDFGMMKEVLTRRLSRGIVEKDLPSALLIDGGKGQLGSVMEIVNHFHITDMAVLAIAKGEKRNAGLETFYLGTDPTTPIHLDLKGDLIHLLQRLRDEAHRFAIGTHRMKRAKNMFHESLTDIDDIGPKRKKALMNHFGSAREIAGASVDQLMRVSGINEKIAKNIYTFYHG